MGKAFILWLLAAIKADILTHSTRAALEPAEAERDAQSVQGQHKQIAKVAAFLPNVIGRLKALLGDLENVTQLQVDKACGLLRVMLRNAIVLHPMADGATRYMTAEGSGDYAITAVRDGANKSGGG